MKTPVYVVSLLRDDDRRNKIEKDFSELGIDFQFFDAVDAKDPKNHALIESMRMHGIGAEMTNGEIACTLSHQLIFKDMLENLHEWAIILEDDVIVDKRFKKFLSSFNDNEKKKLRKDHLYMLGGQKGLHDYPVLGLSLFSRQRISTCSFRRVNYNKKKVRRTCCYLMNDVMADKLLHLTQVHGTYRADSWKLMHQQNIINDFYLDEIILHPVVCGANSHLESERLQASGKAKRPRTYLQKKLKLWRSWLKVSFFSFCK
ncbi:beta-1,4-galactosyltransferase [Pluralibacter gergoviae]|uniref:glycosyltransferase family 25 protein n=1 Tax=Pluralibacter gergoviae TaxID=61647 RepID=UPI000651D055|nr:glycosyltransferase family 25 protein [Pluralibacter gergoviae]KMK17539.1 beta-1,4-galactosyltransferase [Pluralibacter gergoviae]